MLGIITSLSVLTASAVAGEFSVTGSAKATYSIRSSDSANAQVGNPQGIGISNEFTLGASGELDNGYTWTYAQDIDGATVQDDAAHVDPRPLPDAARGGIHRRTDAVQTGSGSALSVPDMHRTRTGNV